MVLAWWGVSYTVRRPEWEMEKGARNRAYVLTVGQDSRAEA